MDVPGITPQPSREPEIGWLIQQHEHDVEALERAADTIAALQARVARYAADQAALILDARRDARRPH